MYRSVEVPPLPESSSRWLLVAVVVALGVFITWIPTFWCGFALIGTVIVLYLCQRQLSLWIGLTAFLCGIYAGHSEPAVTTGGPDLSTYDSVSGIVRSIRIKGDGAQVIVDPLIQGSAAILGRTQDPLRGVVPGSLVVIRGPFESFSGPRNPGGYDPRFFAVLDDVAWAARGSIHFVQPGDPSRSQVFRFRESMTRHFDRLEPHFGARVLMGVLLGDRRAVPSVAIRSFEATGTAHLLAVSGLHVACTTGLVFLCVLALTLALRWRYAHRVAACCAIVPMFGYVLLAQSPLSAQRAGLMVGIVLVCIVIGRRQSGLNTLGIAATVLIMGQPSILASVGFQFSFGVVLALLSFSGDGSGPTQWGKVAAIASLAAAPIQVWHFGTFVPGATLANLVITPIASMTVIPFGLLAVAIAPFTTLPLSLAAEMAEVLVALVEETAQLFGGVWTVGRWSMPLYLLPVLIPVARRSYGAATLLGAGLLCWAGYLMPPDDTVDFISVGQGDAILIRSAGQTALIDAGPSSSAHDLLGHLRIQGVDAIDYVIISHYHPDHFKGLQSLIGTVPIGQLIHSGRQTSNREWESIITSAIAEEVHVRHAESEDLRVGRLHLRVFPPLRSRWLSENDGSIALRIDGPGGSMLLTGDLESVGERRLLELEVGGVDVLKLGHHGSRTSTGEPLMNAVEPRYTVASLGRDNGYGFPHLEVTRRLHAHQVPLFRTDLDGLIRVKMNTGVAFSTPVSEEFSFREAVKPH
jgi:competence protein ComEC